MGLSRYYFRKRVITCLIFILAWFQYAAANIIIDTDNKVCLTSEISVFEDTTGQIVISDLIDLQRLKQAKFTVINKNDNSFGFSSSSFWVRLEYHGSQNIPSCVLKLNYRFIDTMEVFEFTESKEIIRIGLAGAQVDLKDRATQTASLGIPMSLNMSSVYFVRVKSDKPIQIPLEVQSTFDFFEQEKGRDIWVLVYTVILVTLLIVSLIFYVNLKHPVLLWYCLSLVFMWLGLISDLGYGIVYLWSNSPYFNSIAPTFSAGLHQFFMLGFTLLLAKPILNNKVNLFGKILQVHSLLITIATLIVGGGAGAVMTLNGIVLTSIFFIIVGYRSIKQKYYPGVLYFVGWLCLFICSIILFLNIFGMIHFRNPALLLILGSIVEHVFFFIAIANISRRWLKEKQELSVAMSEIRSVKEDNNKSSQQPQVSVLSPREQEVLILIAKGYTDNQMADTLFVSYNTIKTHTKNIYRKLEVANRTEAANVLQNHTSNPF